MERPPIVAMNFTPGFPAADVVDCGPAVFAYGVEGAHVARAVEELAQQIAEREHEFAVDVHSIESALRELSRTPPADRRPIILADTQDNPGAGGTADTTSLLKALIENRTQRVLAGVLCDPPAAARAHEAGVGADIDLALGARDGRMGRNAAARALYSGCSRGWTLQGDRPVLLRIENGPRPHGPVAN